MPLFPLSVSFCLTIIEKLSSSEAKYSFFSFLFVFSVYSIFTAQVKFLTCSRCQYILMFVYVCIYIHICKQTNMHEHIWKDEEPFVFGSIFCNFHYLCIWFVRKSIPFLCLFSIQVVVILSKGFLVYLLSIPFLTDFGLIWRQISISVTSSDRIHFVQAPSSSPSQLCLSVPYFISDCPFEILIQ